MSSGQTESGDPDADAETIVGGAPGKREADTDLPRGSAVDRYVILEPLGHGGMGSVYSAYDPELDRRVALKLLHAPSQADARHAKEAEWRARLMREAQAMARLSHPNVVTVYDVGVTDAGRVFLAMEIVDGGTAASWLKERKRSWRQIVALFCDAGAGLAAAHRAGMIHRDFKLDNVLLGDDGRPRVTDFGLARASEVEPSHARSLSVPPRNDGKPSVRESISSVSLSSPLTLSGTLLGTPGYMAPEQYDTAEDVDARADVFAFCATLYRALYGERPFAGETVEQIASATLNGRVRPAPKGTDVPLWVRRVLLQGMAPDRSARFASMEDALAALRSDPARRRRRWFVLAAVLAGASAAALAVHEVGQHRVRACRVMADRMGGIWDGPRRDAVAAAFDRTRLEYAADNFGKVRRTLDTYASTWEAMTEAACVATRVRGEQSEALLARESACLEDRLDELRALSDVLATADGKVVQRAPQAARSLSPLAPCGDRDRLSAAAPLPAGSAARAEVRALQADVAAAKALDDAGRSLESLDRLQRVRDAVVAAHDGPLLVAWTMTSAYAHGAAGDSRASAAEFEQAATLADMYRLDPQRAEALIELGDLEEAFVHYSESHRWMRLASATIARMGGDARLEVRRDVLEGWTYAHEHKRALAEPLFERALARAQDAHLDAPEFVAYAHSGLADVLGAQGRFEEAIEQMHVCIRALEDADGPQHARVANELTNLAGVELDAGRLNDALAGASRAVSIFEAAVERGDISARSAAEGTARQTVGEALLRLGRPRDAADELARAHDIYRAAEEQEDSAALADNELAEALRSLGRAAEARAAANEASDIEHRVSGVPSETVAGTFAVRARLALDQGKARAALPLAERALTLFERGEPHIHELAEVRLLVAGLLRTSGHDRDRAHSLAEQAREAFTRVHDQKLAGEAGALVTDLQ